MRWLILILQTNLYLDQRTVVMHIQSEAELRR